MDPKEGVSAQPWGVPDNTNRSTVANLLAIAGCCPRVGRTGTSSMADRSDTAVCVLRGRRTSLSPSVCPVPSGPVMSLSDATVLAVSAPERMALSSKSTVLRWRDRSWRDATPRAACSPASWRRLACPRRSSSALSRSERTAEDQTNGIAAVNLGCSWTRADVTTPVVGGRTSALFPLTA